MDQFDWNRPRSRITLVLVLNAVAALIISLGCYFNRRVWHVEEEQEDAESYKVSDASVFQVSR